MRNVMQRLPRIMWWAGFIWRNMQMGAMSRILRAANVLLLQSPPVLAVAATGQKTPSPGSFSHALHSSYTADTSAISRSLSASPLYSGAIARLEVLTAALSSARRVIRVCKWTYTLPGWCKAFTSWRTQVQESVERDLLRRQQEAEAEELEREGKPPVSRAVKVVAAVAAPFRFSHPHPTHVWRRLPWLSSVELLDLSIAVATDVADDLEWLSKYRLFPGEMGYKCGRLAMCLWFTTVVLDLALTFRVIRHYHYQRRELLVQISLAKGEYESGCEKLKQHQRDREEKEYRRLARELKRSPFKVKRGKHPDAEQQEEAENAEPAATVEDHAEAHTAHADGGTSPDSSPLPAPPSSDSSSWSHLSRMPTSSSSDGGASSSGTARSQRSSAAEEEVGEAGSPPKSPGMDKVQVPSEDEAEHHEEENSSDEEADVEAASQSHAMTVAALGRLRSLHHQLAAVQVSLGLQHLNFFKFLADLGCALPMALNVHKEWDGVVQCTGLISGGLGAYKLVLDKNNALTR